MYDFLRGSVHAVDASGRLSLDVNGVGYQLRVSDETRQRIPLDGSVVMVYVRLVVREDDLVLFGFHDPAERAAFDLLTAVQQVGPTVALAVLSTMGVSELRRALIARDVRAFKQVKGVGGKLAERIALELADKVERIPAPLGLPASNATVADNAHAEAHRALVVLGFSPKDANDALARVSAPDLSGEALLRAALAVLR